MKSSFPRIGLRGRILLLTLPAVNLAFVAIWFLATASARQGLVSLSGANLETAAASLADAIAQGMIDTRADATAIARLDITAQAVESGDTKNFALFVDVLVRSKKRYSAIVLTDVKGRIVGSNTVGRDRRRIPSLMGRNASSESWMRKMLGARPPDAQLVPLGRPAFLLDVLAREEEVTGLCLPVTDFMGDRIGTLTVLVSSFSHGEILARFLDRGNEEVDAIAVVSDASGRLVTLPPELTEDPRWRNRDLVIPPAELSGLRHWSGPGGANFLYTQSQQKSELSELGWRVTVMRTVATIEAPVRRMSGRLLWAFIGGISITSMVLIFLATRVVRPIRRLTAAASRTDRASDFEPIVSETQDEVGVLTSAFNEMLADLKKYQHGLEVKVDERTKELRGRNRDMRLVLDNVEQGLVTVSLSGQLALEHSAVITDWFGHYEASMLFSDYIRAIDPAFAEMFELSYEALKEDLLPRELCLDQMPSRIHHPLREVACSYVPILDGEELRGLLIVMNDITEQLQAAGKEAERKELLALFEGFTRDRNGFRSFIEETDQLFARLERSSNEPEVKRIVHTLKGNAQINGLTVIGELCHKLEDEMAEGEAEAAAATLAAAEGRWRQLRASMSALLGDKDRDYIELNLSEVNRLATQLREGLPLPAVLERLAAWQLEPAERALKRLGSAASTLAKRLGKGELELEIAGNSVVIDSSRWGALWSEMIHVVRNAVDHGLERPEVEKGHGKIGPAPSAAERDAGGPSFRRCRRRRWSGGELGSGRCVGGA